MISLFVPSKDSPARWREAVLLIPAFITFLVFAATYNVYDFYVYYIPAILILVTFVGLGVNAGVMFPSKNNFRFGFTLGYDDIEIGTERKSYASTGIISATLLLQITMK